MKEKVHSVFNMHSNKTILSVFGIFGVFILCLLLARPYIILNSELHDFEQCAENGFLKYYHSERNDNYDVLVYVTEEADKERGKISEIRIGVTQHVDDFDQKQLAEQYEYLEKGYNQVLSLADEYMVDDPYLKGVIENDPALQRRFLFGKKTVIQRCYFKVSTAKNEYMIHSDNRMNGFYLNRNPIEIRTCTTRNCDRIVRDAYGECCDLHSCKKCGRKPEFGSKYCLVHKCEKCGYMAEKDSPFCSLHKKLEEEKNNRVAEKPNNRGQNRCQIASGRNTDPYDVYSYSDPDDFADDWAEEFDDYSFDDGYDEAYDYWQEHH